MTIKPLDASGLLVRLAGNEPTTLGFGGRITTAIYLALQASVGQKAISRKPAQLSAIAGVNFVPGCGTGLFNPYWYAWLGSNQQPLPSEGSTLSIELQAQFRNFTLFALLKCSQFLPYSRRNACNRAVAVNKAGLNDPAYRRCRLFLRGVFRCLHPDFVG
jgi:hypothetical protein